MFPITSGSALVAYRKHLIKIGQPFTVVGKILFG